MNKPKLDKFGMPTRGWFSDFRLWFRAVWNVFRNRPTMYLVRLGNEDGRIFLESANDKELSVIRCLLPANPERLQ